MKKATHTILGDKVTLPFPETIEDVRSMCASDEAFLHLIRSGLRQKILTWAATCLKRGYSVRDVEMEAKTYVYKNHKLDKKTVKPR